MNSYQVVEKGISCTFPVHWVNKK